MYVESLQMQSNSAPTRSTVFFLLGCKMKKRRWLHTRTVHGSNAAEFPWPRMCVQSSVKIWWLPHCNRIYICMYKYRCTDRHLKSITSNKHTKNFNKRFSKRKYSVNSKESLFWNSKTVAWWICIYSNSINNIHTYVFLYTIDVIKCFS